MFCNLGTMSFFYPTPKFVLLLRLFVVLPVDMTISTGNKNKNNTKNDSQSYFLGRTS